MMHNKHVCPEYAGDCKDQFPVFSPVGINKKDLAGMIPVFSTIGRGPRGEGVTVKQLEDGTYQFISTTTGEVVSEVPILDVGSFEVINNTPDPVGSEPVSVTIRHTFGGEVKECNLSIPSGEDGASAHACSASFNKNESNRYSLLLSSFTVTPSVGDPVLFKTVDGEDEFLTFGEVYSVIAGTVGVNALSYLGAGWDSPNIGDNGNWWIGNSDTGIPATGPKGDGLPEGGEVGQVMTQTESGPMWVDAAMPDWPLSVDNGGTGATDAAGARDNLDVYSKAEIDERSIRAGFIYVNPSGVLPNGFLWCDGSEHSRTEYPELFAVIGTTYGVGDGLTTFNVPDLQTRVPVGAGGAYALGDQGGEAEHTLTVEEMPSHTHGYGGFYTQTYDWDSNGKQFVCTAASANDGSYAGLQNTGGSQPHNNMQPYTVVNYIISTGKGTGVSVEDIIEGATTLPLGVEYGGTGANTAAGALVSLGVADNVVEENTANGWHYWKYANGWAICSARREATITSWTKWNGEVYYSNSFGSLAYPFTFTEVPHETTTPISDTAAANTVWAIVSSANTAAQTASVLLARAGDGSVGATAYINHLVIGRWK